MFIKAGNERRTSTVITFPTARENYLRLLTYTVFIYFVCLLPFVFSQSYRWRKEAGIRCRRKLSLRFPRWSRLLRCCCQWVFFLPITHTNKTRGCSQHPADTPRTPLPAGWATLRRGQVTRGEARSHRKPTLQNKTAQRRSKRFNSVRWRTSTWCFHLQ